MKNFYSINDVDDLNALVELGLSFKQKNNHSQLGAGKTLAMIFLNPSLRTRLSTEKAAYSLGMHVMQMNAQDTWKWELKDHVRMDNDKSEHIKEASRVISQYADIIAIRSFPKLQNRAEDYQDAIIKAFMKYADVPVINLESSILHPCQSLADMMTIKEYQKKKKNKIVLSWAPHPKALPQAVANSFLSWASKTEHDIVITHPKGYELAEEFTQGCEINYNQREALKDADFVYVKNWSSYQEYGKILSRDPDWMMTADKLALTNEVKLMHCLPVRRNVVIADDALDHENSVIIPMAKNRLHAAQAVLSKLLMS